MSARIPVGRITGAHGVRGLVKVHAFTEDPRTIGALGPLSDETGTRRLVVTPTGKAGDALIARVEGISDRTAAEALRGFTLHVDRDRLPDVDEEEFYHADLIGLRAERLDGVSLGRVVAVHDFGAGDVLEIEAENGRSEMLPFTRTVVPTVDVAGGRIVVDPPFAVETADETDGGEA